ncbi:hypothetical protein [Streptomyces sp. NPDC056160]|uniref:hypothetical protein n=1 Tax=Streptomyces sp. NPDC056160 TaxID=3345731 RepID=UPI0035DE3B65
MPEQQQRPNPYQQPNPYPQPQPQPRTVPAERSGVPVPPAPGGGRGRAGLVAVAVAAVVVVAAGVTGYALLGGGEDGKAGPDPAPTTSPSASQSQDNPRTADTGTATVEGWKVVVNPSAGIKFDVPPQWALRSTGWVTYVSDNDDPDDKPLIAMRAPAFLKEQWCSSDDDKDGRPDHSPLAAAGSRRNNGARSTEDIASTDPGTWVYGQYTQPDRTKVKSGPVQPFTTASGIKGSLGSAWSVGVNRSKKCSTDGKAWTFAFKDPQGDLASWSFFAAKGVSGEVPEATVRKIAATVRTYEAPST